MKKTILFTYLLTATEAFAQTTPTPSATPETPAKPAATVQKPSGTAAASAPAAAPQKPSASIPQPTTMQPPRQGTPLTPTLVAPPASAPLTLEQRHQQELLANAQRIDKANRELLAKNQELQLQNENLGMQVNVIKRDKSQEGIWKGALAVIAGFLMGWYFSGSSGRRKSSW
jgi:hypothetical protein